jgi:hypothetical protein
MASSNTTFFTVEKVAADAGVHRATLHEWIAAELVTPNHEVTGSNSSTPVFTAAERQRVLELARERKRHREALRLSPT